MTIRARAAREAKNFMLNHSANIKAEHFMVQGQNQFPSVMSD
ncbi:hypothetical protein SynBIOSU31_01854 [Synechococcus sp. BIOS-U3-1]|nr:hypothetical protein SynBIOSU31_01854 [Synechococcus sp. BIOS-U3-1]